MRVYILWLFVVALWIACNNDTGDGATAKPRSIDSSVTRDNRSNAGATQKSGWTKKEQSAFLQDCLAEATSHLTGEKLNAFCDCMLLNSQKHYSKYSEMDKKSNEESDASIFEACADLIDDEDTPK
jgi:hypothetical protein